MEGALRVSTTVLPGGRVEVTDPLLPSGKSVDVIILFPESGGDDRRSIVEALAEAPGQALFSEAKAVDLYLREERDSWGD